MPPASSKMPDVTMNISAARSQKPSANVLPLMDMGADEPSKNVSSTNSNVPASVATTMRRAGTRFSVFATPPPRLRSATMVAQATAHSATTMAKTISNSITSASSSVLNIILWFSGSFLLRSHSPFSILIHQEAFILPIASSNVMLASSICATIRSIFVLI